MNKATYLEARSRIYDNLGEIALALGSPVRLRIIQFLTNRSQSSVEEISQGTGQLIGSTSQHLQKLRQAGLVRVKKEGVSRIYSLSNPDIISLWINLQELAVKISPEIRDDEELLSPSDLCSSRSLKEVLKDVKSNKALIIDVREDLDVLGTPVEGSLKIPAKKVLEASKKFVKNRPIYLFCRGRYCDLATTAVLALRERGYEAYRLKENSAQLNQFFK